MNNIEYKENIIFTAFNYIAWFVLANLYFLASNILFIGYNIIFRIHMSANISLLFFITLIPMGPSLTALCASMGKIIREKDINITRYYIKSYKINFKQSLQVWCAELGILFISYINLNLSTNGGVLSQFTILFISICVFVVVIGIFVFPIISRFDFKTIDAIKIAFIYSIKKIHITVINMSVLLIGVFFIYILPGVVFLCLSSLICFVIMFNNKGIISEIENELALNQ
jgi:Predicted integral membrane protein